MIYYHSKIKIIRNDNFKKHNTLLKYFLKRITTTYKDIYYALNNDLNCITMNDKSDITDSQLTYAKYLGIDIIDEYHEKFEKFVSEYKLDKKYYEKENNRLIW